MFINKPHTGIELSICMSSLNIPILFNGLSVHHQMCGGILKPRALLVGTHTAGQSFVLMIFLPFSDVRGHLIYGLYRGSQVRVGSEDPLQKVFNLFKRDQVEHILTMVNLKLKPSLFICPTLLYMSTQNNLFQQLNPMGRDCSVTVLHRLGMGAKHSCNFL